MELKDLPSQIPDTNLGKAHYLGLQAMSMRFPRTHKGNIHQKLQSVHASPQNPDIWQRDRVRLSDDEYASLAKIMKSDPVVSSVVLSKSDFPTVSASEFRRAAVAKWFTGEKAPLVDFIDDIELKLFTDGTEVVIGWEGTGDQRRGWVLRAMNISDEQRKTVDERTSALKGVTPETKVVQSGEEALVLSEYIEGRYASDDDIVRFRQLLAEREIPETLFDMNGQNIIRATDGRLVYVDRDYLGLGHPTFSTSQRL